MPAGARRLILAAGSLVALGACTDGVAMAPSPAEAVATSAPVADADITAADIAAADVVSTSTPGSVASSPTTADPSTTTTTTTSEPAATTTVPVADSTPTSDDPAACQPVVALADAVALAEGIDFSLPWPDLQADLVASSEAAAQSYLAVVAVAPSGVDAGLTVLADYNRAIGASAMASASITEFQAAVAAPDAALLGATTDVDRYMRATCSIGLSAD